MIDYILTYRVYFVLGINNMRCGTHRLLEIVKNGHHLCTDNGNVLIFMSKNHRTVKMVNFEEYAYNASLGTEPIHHLLVV